MATNNADIIVGTLGDDIIDALGGRDTIYATQGHDSVDGGANLNDRIIATLADPTRFADPATASRTYTITNNHLGSSSGGLDTSFINVERITLELGGTGDFGDTIDATSFTGGFALDLRLGNGNDIVFGGAGNESIYARGGINWIDAGAGTDSVAADVDFASGSTVFVMGSGNQVQTVHNGIITNTILNAEQILIGTNIDLPFAVDGLTHTVNASAYTGAAQIVFYDHNGNDIFIGSSGSDVFANLYNATVGDDIYTGNGGADIYDYTVAVNALNNDVITDFDADDTIDFRFNDGASAPGQLLCNSYIGAAAFSGVAGQYRYAISGNQTLIQIDTDGDAAADRTLTIANGTFVIAETFAGSNVLRLAGTVIQGTAGPDVLTGTSGADIITNGGGIDTIRAGDGDDTIVLNAQVGAGSVLDGGAGFDTLELKTQPGVPSILGGTITQYNGYFPSVPVSLEAVKYDSALGDVLSLVVVDPQRAAAGLTTLIGGGGRDLFYDVVFQPGTYTMPLLTFSNWTSDLNDPSCDFVILLASSGGNYTLNAREGLGVLQALRGNSGDDVLNGSSGNDLLNGRGGINQLYGNAGDDLLYAENLTPFGGSASTLTFSGNIYNGGSGSDTLVIGGSVNFQGTLVSVEKIYFEPAAPSPAPGVDGFDPARLILSGSNALTLAGNANIGGNGTFVINLDATSSAIDISGWQFAGAAPINFFGNGDDKTIQIYGTGNDDLIRDADSGDVLWGNGGNDTIYGNGGDDAIRGGAGADTLYGGAGHDTIYGGFTRDIVQPQSGDLGDTIDGGAGNDRIRGGDGDDYIFGGADDDNLRGDAGNDTIDGGDGFDFVSYNFSNLTTSVTFDLRAVTGGSNPQTVSDGQGGIDTLLNIEWTGIAGSQADDALFGSTTLVNELIGNGGNDQLVGGLADDYLDGGLGNDVLDGGAGNDAIYGGAGDDLIRGRLGDDLIDGGDGFDRAGYYHTDAAAGGVTVNLNIVGPQNTGSQGWDTLTSIEYVSGTPFADTLVGDANDNILWGYVATIDPDTNWVSTTNNDTLDGGGGNDLLYAGIGNHSLTGGSGIDTVGFTENWGDDPAIHISLALQGVAQDTGQGLWTLSGIENLSGGGGNDQLTGDYNANILAGSFGNDTLNGGGGNDSLYGDGVIDSAAPASGPPTLFPDVGASGNDTLEGGEGDDILWGGGGSDTASYASASGAVDVGLYNGGGGEAFGAAGYDQLHEIENITGSAFNDSLTGNALANVLAGGDGVDALRGGGGNDALYGGNGNDFINGGNGNDFVDGGAGIDRAAYFQSNAALGGITVSLLLQGTAQYVGSQGWDTLVNIENVSGTPFADILTGDGGDNWLWGSTSWLGAVQSATNNDTIDGGGGNDLIEVGLGNHILTGGADNDTVWYSENGGAEVGITVSLALQGAAQVTGAGSWTLSEIENLKGGTGNDQLTGDENANVLTGGGGNDQLVGGAGSDQAGYTGNAADFSVVSLGGGAWRVSDLNAADGDEGIDLILGIEQLRFADQLVTLNEAPVANSETFQTDEDTALGGQLAASDLENGPLNYQLVSGPANGTLSFNPDGTFLYTPAANFFGADSFTFTVSDGTTTSNVATADLVIAPVDNDAATIGGQLTGELTEGINPAAPNGIVSGQLSASDPDGPTSFTAGSRAGTWGAFTISAGGGWSYELADNDPFIGALKASDTVTDSFTVTTADGSSSLVTVTIHGANDAAVIGGTRTAALSEAALLGGTSQVTGTLTISDIDSPAQFVAAALAGLYGTLTLNAAGSWNYVLNNANPVVDGLSNGDSLSDSFTVFAADGTAQPVLVTVTGSDDVRTGTNNADALSGTTGNDTLNGNNGNDVLSGGLGNDVLNGGNGIDTATYAGLAAGVTVSLEISTAQNTLGGGIDTLLSIENLTGTSQADVLTGNASNNTLNGGDGNDVLQGGAGDDILNGGNGIDTASYGSAASAVTVSLAVSASQRTGGAGFDTLTGIENLVGSGFADTLIGNSTANVLTGGAGADRLTGGGGADVLFGGLGDDVFNYAALLDSGPTASARDIIRDFQGAGIAGGDLIDLSAIDAIAGGRDNAFAFIGSAAFSGVSGQLRFDTTATPGFTTVQGDTNGDGVADFQIMLQWSDASSEIILNAQDFVL